MDKNVLKIEESKAAELSHSKRFRCEEFFIGEAARSRSKVAGTNLGPGQEPELRNVGKSRTLPLMIGRKVDVPAQQERMVVKKRGSNLGG